MADEATDALIPEAPSTEDAAPVEAPAPDPYEKRYADLRSEFDRKNALIDRATKGDVEAIRNLGFEYDEPDEDPTPDYVEDDPYAAKLAQYEEKISRLEAAEQRREADRIADGIRSHVDSLAKEEGIELSDYDKEVIFRGAVGGDKIDADVTAAAFKAHAEYIKGKEEQYNTAPRPPRPGTGQAVEKQPDLDNPQERREWMKSQLGI